MEEIKRVRYFQHQLLQAVDFEAEQKYHRTMRYRHNLVFHTWGIGYGLEVTPGSGQQPGEGTVVTVSAGAALDGDGREIVLTESRDIDFNQPQYQPGQTYYITISWHEAAASPVQMTEPKEAKRWHEVPAIEIAGEPPADEKMKLVLAKATLAASNTVAEIDTGMRKYAALKIGDTVVTSVKIAAADGTSGQDIGSGSGIKTRHLQDGAVTEEKLDSRVAAKLVNHGNNHNHDPDNGNQIRHDHLIMTGETNPHQVGMSQLSDFNAQQNKIINLPDPTAANDAANKAYVDQLAGGVISSDTDIENVTTNRTRQLNVSEASTASGIGSQVNASIDSIASGSQSQVNAGNHSIASIYQSQVNASVASTASGFKSQVNASAQSTASGSQSQVNACTGSVAKGLRSQVNAGTDCSANYDNSQVNASINSKADHLCSQVNASIGVETAFDYRICGGYGIQSQPGTANRKWELDSMHGDFFIAGTVYSETPFSDYGEYFENEKNGVLPTGVLIALSGAKVRAAKKDEDFIGVVSATAAIRLGNSAFCWQGRFLKDEWGQPVYEKIKDPYWKPKTIPDPDWSPGEGESEAQRPMIAVESEKDRPFISVQKENPDYDPAREQLPRSQRPKEWTLVGLLGQVLVRCDQTVKPGDYIKSKNKGIGTSSSEKTKLRAMKITKRFDGKYAIVNCLLIS